MRKLAYILLLLGAVFLAGTFIGCRKVGKTITTKETVKITYRDTTVVIPKEIVSTTFNYDSIQTVLKQYLKAGLKPQIIYRNTPTSPTNLTISLDSLGNIKADCATDEQLIEFMQKEIERLSVTKQKIVVHVTPPWVKWIIGGFLFSLIAFLLLKGYKII